MNAWALVMVVAAWVGWILMVQPKIVTNHWRHWLFW